MKLTVFYGDNCPKCPAAKQVCKEVAEEKGIAYEEKDIKDCMIEALQLQIASTPSIVFNEEVLFRTDTPLKEDLMAEVEKRCNI